MFKNNLDIHFKEGIYELNIKNSITQKVGKFYAENPFPDYKIDDTKHTIQKIGDNNLLMKELKRLVGFNKSLLEVGSGTCQLSNYLAIGTNNKICAFDGSLQSLKLGKEFAKKNNIQNVDFVRGDIFDKIFEDGAFDFIWLRLCSSAFKSMLAVAAFIYVIRDYSSSNAGPVTVPQPPVPPIPFLSL